MGLILGAALAGGLQGAGQAAQTSLGLQQKQLGEQDLLKMQEDLDEQKLMRLQESQQTFQGQQATQAQNFQQQMQAEQLGAQQNMEGDREDNALEIAKNSNATELAAANIHVGGEIAAAKIAASASLMNAKLAVSGRNIQTLADGSMVSIGFDPSTNTQTVRPLLDPTTGQPIKGAKNLSESQIKIGASYLDQASALLKLDPQNPEAQKMMDTGRAILNGGAVPGGTSQTVAPATAVAYLLAHPDSNTQSQFDAKYGPGQAKALIQQSTKTPPVTTPAVAPVIPAGAAPFPVSTGAPTDGTVNPPLPPGLGTGTYDTTGGIINSAIGNQ